MAETWFTSAVDEIGRVDFEYRVSGLDIEVFVGTADEMERVCPAFRDAFPTLTSPTVILNWPGDRPLPEGIFATRGSSAHDLLAALAMAPAFLGAVVDKHPGRSNVISLHARTTGTSSNRVV